MEIEYMLMKNNDSPSNESEHMKSSFYSVAHSGGKLAQPDLNVHM